MSKFNKDQAGSEVKVFTPEAIKAEMKELQDLRRDAGLPYLSQAAIYQELYTRYFPDYLEKTAEAIKRLQEV